MTVLHVFSSEVIECEQPSYLLLRVAAVLTLLLTVALAVSRVAPLGHVCDLAISEMRHKRQFYGCGSRFNRSNSYWRMP